MSDQTTPLEPNRGHAYDHDHDVQLSIAISLKRIADVLDSVRHEGKEGGYILTDTVQP